MRAILFACVFLVHTLAFSEDLGGVAGEIRGIDGKPAKGVRVAAAFAAEEPNGELVPVRAQIVGTTDDLGRYRLSNITSGRYRRCAALHAQAFACATVKAEANSWTGCRRRESFHGALWSGVVPGNFVWSFLIKAHASPD